MQQTMKKNRKEMITMNEYTDDDLDFAARELASAIREVRTESKVTPAKADVVYLAEAAELCNVGVNGNMVYSILLKQIKADMYNKIDDMMKKYGWLIALIVIMMGLVLCVAYITQNLLSGA